MAEGTKTPNHDKAKNGGSLLSALTGLVMPNTWMDWPEYTGQQFIHYRGQTWVGSVDVDIDADDLGGSRITIWRGGGHYTVWSKLEPNHGFKFMSITWPEPPVIKSGQIDATQPVSADEA